MLKRWRQPARRKRGIRRWRMAGDARTRVRHSVRQQQRRRIRERQVARDELGARML